MGLPVVATRHAGIADVVEHGKTGFLVEEKDVDSMAKHMLKLASEPEMAEEMGRAGRERIQNKYSMKMSIDKLADILRNASTK